MHFYGWLMQAAGKTKQGQGFWAVYMYNIQIVESINEKTMIFPSWRGQQKNK